VDFLVHMNTTTTAPHHPDDILERAKGQSMDAVLVVGRLIDGTTWISASTSNAERLVFLLELAKRRVLDSLMEGGVTAVVDDQPRYRGSAMSTPFSEAAFAAGDTLHSDCDCCEHAAKRTVTLRGSIKHAIEMIKGGFPGETMFELDRVLSELNKWCDAPPDAGGMHPDDLKTPF